KCPRLWHNAKDCLDLAGKVGRIPGLIPIDSLRTVAIIEEKCLISSLINQHAAEKAVELFKKAFALLFIEVNQPIVVSFDAMSLSSQLCSRFRIDETLAREQEHDISRPVTKRVAGYKRTLAC